MVNNNRNRKEELFVKSFKHGTGTLVLSKQGVEPETGHEEMTKRVNRVSNSYKDQKWGSNEFGPLFVPVENICHWSALHPSVYG
jgi:hypothetical protein